MSTLETSIDKEAVYDSKISPLVKEIIKICEESKIAVVASFHVGGKILMTTSLVGDAYDPPSLLIELAGEIYRRSSEVPKI